jgi:hypothetical protein
MRHSPAAHNKNTKYMKREEINAMKTRAPIVFYIVFNTICIFAETPTLKLDLPLFDLPYQIDAMNTAGYGFFSSYINPSMAQSTAVTTDIYSAFHYSMGFFYNSTNMNITLKEIIYYGGTVLGDLVLTYMSGGDGWLHEEFHRAVMSRYRTNSFNGMNLFPFGAEMVSVSKVRDEDLIRFKAESPADFIRMHEAGIEGQYLLTSRLQRNNFFYHQNSFNEFLYWTMTLNSHLYVTGSAPLSMSVRVYCGTNGSRRRRESPRKGGLFQGPVRGPAFLSCRQNFRKAPR